MPVAIICDAPYCHQQCKRLHLFHPPQITYKITTFLLSFVSCEVTVSFVLCFNQCKWQFLIGTKAFILQIDFLWVVKRMFFLLKVKNNYTQRYLKKGYWHCKILMLTRNYIKTRGTAKSSSLNRKGTKAWAHGNDHWTR